MPRNPEPSYKLKTIIWDIAVKLGKSKITAIQRELDYHLEELRKDGDFYENIPSVKTIKNIIEKDINLLSQDIVISQLPQHVWPLRNDYETLKQLAERVSQVSQITTDHHDTNTTQEDAYDSKMPVFISAELRRYLRQQLVRHSDDLAQTARLLSDNMARLKSFGEFLEIPTSPLDISDAGMIGNIVDGGKIGLETGDGNVDPWGENDDLTEVDNLLATCLLEHFKYRFPKIVSFRNWREVEFRNVKQEIVDKLMLLATSRNFGYCPNCSVCKDLSL